MGSRSCCHNSSYHSIDCREAREGERGKGGKGEKGWWGGGQRGVSHQDVNNRDSKIRYSRERERERERKSGERTGKRKRSERA